MLGVEVAETVFEPCVGGHLYDRGVDGSECRWARVLAYEPPNRVVISWDFSPHWQLETDLEKTSEVEVRFVSETPDRTRVELEHPQPRAARRRPGSPPRRCRRRGWLAAVLAEVRRAAHELSSGSASDGPRCAAFAASWL